MERVIIRIVLEAIEGRTSFYLQIQSNVYSKTELILQIPMVLPHKDAQHLGEELARELDCECSGIFNYN